jgi:hypothetical protein
MKYEFSITTILENGEMGVRIVEGTVMEEQRDEILDCIASRRSFSLVTLEGCTVSIPEPRRFGYFFFSRPVKID